jgi:hypothetical protein
VHNDAIHFECTVKFCATQFTLSCLIHPPSQIVCCGLRKRGGKKKRGSQRQLSIPHIHHVSHTCHTSHMPHITHATHHTSTHPQSHPSIQPQSHTLSPKAYLTQSIVVQLGPHNNRAIPLQCCEIRIKQSSEGVSLFAGSCRTSSAPHSTGHVGELVLGFGLDSSSPSGRCTPGC